MTRTFQLYGDRVLTDTVVAAGIASDAPLGIGVRHGWRRVGEPMLVTAGAGNRVHSLDDRPALDAYLERLGVVAPGNGDQEWLARLVLTHPLGLGRPGGEERVRFINGGDFAERSLSCMAEVPQGPWSGSWREMPARCSTRPTQPAAIRSPRSTAVRRWG